MFGLGVCCYFIIFEEDNKIRPVTLVGVFSWAFCAYFLAYNQLILNIFNFGVPFAIMTVALSRWPSRVFVNWLTVQFGKVSFSLYLIHLYVFHGAETILNKSAIYNDFQHAKIKILFTFIFKSALAFSAAYVTYMTIEKPFVRLGSEIIRRLDGARGVL